tara:strand:- start:3920 stop:4258 length:339 start_codon:yes stop_codon:yes gene_type:complete
MNVTVPRRRAASVVGHRNLAGVRGVRGVGRPVAGWNLLIVLALATMMGGAPSPSQDQAPQQHMAFTPIPQVIQARRPFYQQEWFWGIASTTVITVVTIVWAKKRRRAKHEEA